MVNLFSKVDNIVSKNQIYVHIFHFMFVLKAQ